MAMSVSTDGTNVACNADGEFNTQPLNGSISLAVAGRNVNELLVPPYAYLQIPSATSTWQRIDLGALGSSGVGSSVDVQQTIGFLRTVGTVSSVGAAAIDGVPTTHYHAVIDVNRLAAALPLPQGASSASGLAALANALGGSGLPLDVWVDAQEHVRQITMSIPLQAGSGGVQFSLTMQLYDYGSQPVVGAPPPGEVSALGAPSQ
jgi:PPE-repeat protein